MLDGLSPKFNPAEYMVVTNFEIERPKFDRKLPDSKFVMLAPAFAGVNSTGHPGQQVQTPVIAILDALSSQTKCNTLLRWCCYGNKIQSALLGRAVYACPFACRRANDPANRCSYGSLGIDDQPRIKTQQRQQSGLSTRLRRQASLGAAQSERLWCLVSSSAAAKSMHFQSPAPKAKPY